MLAAPPFEVSSAKDPMPFRLGAQPPWSSTLRSPASGVGTAIRSLRKARRTVLHAARARRWHFDAEKWRLMLSHWQTDLQTTQRQVGAEVDEFIQSPHLLFAPIRMAVTLAVPLLIPLCFMPTFLLAMFVVFTVLWYTSCLLLFATEVAMRPPWYKRGLPSKDLPPYWKGFVHDPLVDLGFEFDDVEFPSGSGGLLRGWVVRARKRSGKFALFVHGVGRDRRTFLRHAGDFLGAGYSCLLFDLSEHGLSDGASKEFARGTLFGAREQYDVVAAAEFLKFKEGAERIVFVGTSCGASSSIMAAAARPDLVDCVVGENPFTRADELLRHHLDSLSKNYLSQNSHQTVRGVVFWLAGRLLMVRMGYYIRSYGAIDVVGKLECPLLIAHSTEDDVVPYEHGVRIYEAAMGAKEGNKDMAFFFKCSEAAHCALYDKDPEMWTGMVLPFVQRALERREKGEKGEKGVAAGTE